MASQEEVNRQRQLNQETERTLTLEQEILNVISRRAGIDPTTLNNQQDIGNTLNDQLKLLRFQNQEKRILRSITTQINNLAKESYGLGVETLGNEKDRVKLQKEIYGLESNIRVLNQQRLKFRSQEDELSQAIADSLKMQVEDAQELLKELKNIANISDEVSKNFGVKIFGTISDLTKSIPGLRKLSEPFQKAGDASRSIAAGMEEAIRSGGSGLTREKIKQLGIEKQVGNLTGTAASAKLKGMSGFQKGLVSVTAGFKVLGPIIAKALGPLALFTELVLAIGRADKETVELQKSMSLTRGEAIKFRQELTVAADKSGDINITSTKLLETFSNLNKQFGFITNFATDTLVTMTKLTKVVGIGAESAGNLAAASSLTGGSFENNYKDVLATSYELQRQSGVQIDLRDILEQSGKVTGTVRANLGANPALIAKAITQAKLFGASLNDVADAGKALLNFEQSIEAELQAELLLGKNINLERARAAALAGDQVTLAQELQKEAGNFEEFTRMNVIQQEALAQAMGMTSDKLADILFQQEIQGKTARELRAIGKDELADRLESQTAATKFTAAMEKLKSVVTDVVVAFTPILDIVSSIASFIGQIISALGPFKQVLGAAATGAAAGSIIPGVGTAAGAIVGGIGGLLTMNDGIIPSGYGDTIIKKGKDTIALNNQDTVVAGTNLGKGTDMSETNQLLKMLVRQNDKKPEISPVGLYQVQ